MAGEFVTVRVDGARRLRRDLRAVAGDLEDLKAANGKVAAIVAGAVDAPVKSGRLAASVRGNRAAGRATVSAGGASLPYAGPIHYGWPAHGIEGNPFITDAAQRTESTWLPAYEADLARATDRVTGTY